MKAKYKVLYESGNYSITKKETKSVMLLSFDYDEELPTIYVFRRIETGSKDTALTRPVTTTRDVVINAGSDDLAIREAIKLHDSIE